MPINVSGQTIHNGFILSEPFIHNGNMVVLTGRNGCGKTRLLESIKNQMSVVDLAGVRITNQEIMLVGQAQLTPNFGGAYNDGQFQTKITSSLQMFDRIKNQFDSPLSHENARNYGRMQEDSLPYESLFRLCSSISQYLNKRPSELTHDEIKVHFEDHIHSVLGSQNISSICNRYIQRKKLNKYNKYCAEQEGEDVSYLSEESFLNRFGDEPWKIINKIIESTFDNKFKFSEPDTLSQSYSYNATLIQQGSGLPVAVDALSSGEKTLLWLALTLFNSQYYDHTAVQAPKLLLLDEPDAFLHPQMVVKMYRVLTEFSESFKSRIFITTHSPTTVALSPENSTYIVSENSISPVTKDEGVAELLDGVTQISINPENRRQVFVESQYDADVYQSIYAKLLHSSKCLDPKISLNFVSSGPKMPEQQLKDKVKQILKIHDENLLNEFIKSINGVGNCVQVVGQVKALEQGDNKTVRGIIDWDLKNKPSKHVSVLAQNFSYSIENITLDPICILLLLHTNKPDVFTMAQICGVEVHWSDWLNNDKLLQESVNRFIYKVLGEDNNKEEELSYVSGKTLLTDSRYLKMKGHPLEKLIKEKYGALNEFSKTGKEGELKYSIVSKSMVNLTNGRFIPSVFENVLSLVQK
ncbi:ATP-binding protein [Shewanella sp. OMA3-2]|uniref:ATP-binding protein n=1 Tax=Shewanella sp. OMA3-2 TaxID=2908650 RepID=UPI001F2472F6|nr:ATP-binding protein [Shewanella sp. OMA3-2]UJF22718.1 ATP-binding protein [Shewanella sp. OMA3-2]